MRKSNHNLIHVKIMIVGLLVKQDTMMFTLVSKPVCKCKYTCVITHCLIKIFN